MSKIINLNRSLIYLLECVIRNKKPTSSTKDALLARKRKVKALLDSAKKLLPRISATSDGKLDDTLVEEFNRLLASAKSLRIKFVLPKADKGPTTLEKLQTLIKTLNQTLISIDKAITSPSKKTINHIDNFKDMLLTKKDGFISFLKMISDKHHLLTARSTDSTTRTISALPTKDDEILKRLAEENKKYGYFDTDTLTHEKFKTFCLETYKVMKFIADFVENNETDGSLAFMHTYKVLAIFLNLKDLDKDQCTHPLSAFKKYLNRYCNGLRIPVHDALVDSIPKACEIKNPEYLARWKRSIIKTGISVMRRFARATELKKYLLPKEVDKTDGTSLTLKEIKSAEAKFEYKLFDENPTFAKLCKQYGVNEETFNECLGIIKSGAKKSDTLPNTIVDGKDIRFTTKDGAIKTLKGYYLLKLPPGDPMALIVGFPTECCQRIGGDAETCAIDSFKRANNAVCVLLQARSKKFGAPNPKKIDYEKFDVIGQGYLLKAISGNLYFDSWENRYRPENPIDLIAVGMLKAWAKKAIEKDPKIWRITIGTGGGTPMALKHRDDHVPSREVSIEGEDYGDAEIQSLLASNDNINRKVKEIYDLLTSKISRLDSAFLKEITTTYTSLISKSASLPYTASLNINYIKLSSWITSYQQYSFFKTYINNLTTDIKILSDGDIFMFLISTPITYLYNKKSISFPKLKSLSLALIKLDRLSEKFTFGLTPLVVKTPVVSFFIALSTNREVREILSTLEIHSDDDYLGLCGLSAYISIKDIFDFIKGLYNNTSLKKDQKIKILRLLVSENALTCYKQNKEGLLFPGFDYLKSLSFEKIKALTTDSILACYKHSKKHSFLPSLKDIIKFDAEKITELTCINARDCYKSNFEGDPYPSFNDLCDLDSYGISLLSSHNARDCYQRRKRNEYFPSGNDLYKLVKQEKHSVIFSLTSVHARICYKARKESKIYPSFYDLKDFESDKISSLIPPYALRCYKASTRSKFFPSFDEIKKLKIPEVDKLLLYCSYHVDKDGKIKWRRITASLGFHDLKDCKVDKIILLTSCEVDRCLRERATNKHMPSLADLKSLDVKKIKILTSNTAYYFYQSRLDNNNFLSFHAFNLLEIEKTKQLLSENVIKYLKLSPTIPTYFLKKLSTFSIEKIKHLISPDVINKIKNNERLLLPVVQELITNYKNSRRLTWRSKKITNEHKNRIIDLILSKKTLNEIITYTLQSFLCDFIFEGGGKKRLYQCLQNILITISRKDPIFLYKIQEETEKLLDQLKLTYKAKLLSDEQLGKLTGLPLNFLLKHDISYKERYKYRLFFKENYRRYCLTPDLFTKEKLTEHLRSALYKETAAPETSAVVTSTPSASAS